MLKWLKLCFELDTDEATTIKTGPGEGVKTPIAYLKPNTKFEF